MKNNSFSLWSTLLHSSQCGNFSTLWSRNKIQYPNPQEKLKKEKKKRNTTKHLFKLCCSALSLINRLTNERRRKNIFCVHSCIFMTWRLDIWRHSRYFSSFFGYTIGFSRQFFFIWELSLWGIPYTFNYFLLFPVIFFYWQWFSFYCVFSDE